MAEILSGGKKLKIDKNQRAALIAVGLASFILIFSGIFSWQLYKKMAFQSHVVKCLRVAKENIIMSRNNVNALKTSYEEFNKSDNLIGAEGPNAGVVLKSLPVQYLHSETYSAWEAFLGPGSGLNNQGYLPDPPQITLPPTLENDATEETTSSELQTIDIGLQVDLRNAEELDKLFEDLNNFIMPLRINDIDLTIHGEEGLNDNYGSVSLNLQTYFQPGINIQFPTESITDKGVGGKCGTNPADASADEESGTGEEGGGEQGEEAQ